MTTAIINLWNKRVGAVLWDENSQLASFEYDPDFINENLDISPIKMPIGTRGRIFSFPELVRNNTFKGLSGLLADILPDKYGNALINAWLVANRRRADSMNPVEMLCFVGKRGMGALEFEPATAGNSDRATKIEIDGLVHIAGKILQGRQDFMVDMNADEQKALMDIFRIGTSAGGARAKALIAYNERTREVRSGQAKAPEGFNHWLIKFDGVHDSQFGATYGFGRVEYAYHLMAVACGIEMTECRLLEENDRAHFMTKRFDRTPDKLHVQTWCAMEHFDFNNVGLYSYEQLFQTMRVLRLPYPQAEQLFRRMVFNVIARNCDDHSKNFAFIMDKKGEWTLSPAYDVCHAYRPGSVWVSTQSLMINGKRDGIARADLLEVARRMNIKSADSIVEDIQDKVDNWEAYADRGKVSEKLREGIKTTLLKL